MRVGTRSVIAGMLIAALLCAGGLSYYASSAPDGLNKVAADQGFNADERTHDLGGSPLAGYETAGVDDERMSTALAGVSGVAVTLLLAGGLFLVVRRREPSPGPRE